MTDSLDVLDQGLAISFSFEDLMRYHGPGSPGGVAHAFKVMQRAFPLLDPEGTPDRAAIGIETAFGGPGARDAFELVTRAVTGGRYTVDARLERPDRGRSLERFVFRLSHGDREVTLVAREGTVTDEFTGLVRTEGRTPEQEDRLTVLKREMADRLMASPAEEVYDVV
jgi:hypothetical protein